MPNIDTWTSDEIQYYHKQLQYYKDKLVVIVTSMTSIRGDQLFLGTVIDITPHWIVLRHADGTRMTLWQDQVIGILEERHATEDETAALDAAMDVARQNMRSQENQSPPCHAQKSKNDQLVPISDAFQRNNDDVSIPMGSTNVDPMTRQRFRESINED